MRLFKISGPPHAMMEAILSLTWKAFWKAAYSGPVSCEPLPFGDDWVWLENWLQDRNLWPHGESFPAPLQVDFPFELPSRWRVWMKLGPEQTREYRRKLSQSGALGKLAESAATFGDTPEDLEHNRAILAAWLSIINECADANRMTMILAGPDE